MGRHLRTGVRLSSSPPHALKPNTENFSLYLIGFSEFVSMQIKTISAKQDPRQLSRVLFVIICISHIPLQRQPKWPKCSAAVLVLPVQPVGDLFAASMSAKMFLISSMSCSHSSMSSARSLRLSSSFPTAFSALLTASCPLSSSVLTASISVPASRISVSARCIVTSILLQFPLSAPPQLRSYMIQPTPRHTSNTTRQTAIFFLSTCPPPYSPLNRPCPRYQLALPRISLPPLQRTAPSRTTSKSQRSTVLSGPYGSCG